MTTLEKPVVALTLGDPAGIGAELIARLLAQSEVMECANIVLVGDAWAWREGQRVAGVEVGTEAVSGFDQVRKRANLLVPAWLEMETVAREQVHVGRAEAPGGASVLKVLDACMEAAQRGDVDAICFAPLNKYAMKLGGLKHDDELHHFAQRLGVTRYFCEFNTLGNLWTSRVSSHIPLKNAAAVLSIEGIKDATRLIYRSLQANGIAAPRVAVAAFNPHGGDGGTCGREEVDIIAPAVRQLNEEGMPVAGPFPADTIFLKAQAGEFEAVVTMYHDQGQIAIKLLGFSRGVTVQGGLPIPITTPAHGTAYDIAGLGCANVDAMHQAFLVACRMGTSHRLNQAALRL